MSSETLVSCKQSTSGSFFKDHSSTCPSRDLIELIFQVAIFTVTNRGKTSRIGRRFLPELDVDKFQPRLSDVLYHVPRACLLPDKVPRLKVHGPRGTVRGRYLGLTVCHGHSNTVTGVKVQNC